MKPPSIKKPPSSHGKERLGSVYLNLGSDGDQWIISPTKKGGVVITHIPPRQPVTGALTSVVSALAGARAISAEHISAHFRTSEASGREVMDGIAMLGAVGAP
jgi:hypothetical protein